MNATYRVTGLMVLLFLGNVNAGDKYHGVHTYPVVWKRSVTE